MFSLNFNLSVDSFLHIFLEETSNQDASSTTNEPSSFSSIIILPVIFHKLMTP